MSFVPWQRRRSRLEVRFACRFPVPPHHGPANCIVVASVSAVAAKYSVFLSSPDTVHDKSHCPTYISASVDETHELRCLQPLCAREDEALVRASLLVMAFLDVRTSRARPTALPRLAQTPVVSLLRVSGRRPLWPTCSLFSCRSQPMALSRLGSFSTFRTRQSGALALCPAISSSIWPCPHDCLEKRRALPVQSLKTRRQRF